MPTATPPPAGRSKASGRPGITPERTLNVLRITTEKATQKGMGNSIELSAIHLGSSAASIEVH